LALPRLFLVGYADSGDSSRETRIYIIYEQSLKTPLEGAVTVEFMHCQTLAGCHYKQMLVHAFSTSGCDSETAFGADITLNCIVCHLVSICASEPAVLISLWLMELP
jgi:hypothetical protein